MSHRDAMIKVKTVNPSYAVLKRIVINASQKIKKIKHAFFRRLRIKGNLTYVF